MKGKRLSVVLLIILAVALPLLLLLGIKQALNTRSNAAAADKLETEDGTLSSGASEQTDSSASGGKYVLLGTNTSNPNKYEAENFTLTSPIQIGSDTNAVNSQYIYKASGTTSTSPVREAYITVPIPTTGTYYLWARIMGPTPDSDALYVGIDSSWDRIFPSTVNTYEWVRVENSLNSGVNGISLTAGNHTVQLGYGETGARLDSVYLTTDPDEIPTFGNPGGSNSPTPTKANTPTPTTTTNTGFEVQGYGAQVTGGAGMPVVHVTNLNDSGPGSLRQALSGV